MFNCLKISPDPLWKTEPVPEQAFVLRHVLYLTSHTISAVFLLCLRLFNFISMLLEINVPGMKREKEKQCWLTDSSTVSGTKISSSLAVSVGEEASESTSWSVGGFSPNCGFKMKNKIKNPLRTNPSWSLMSTFVAMTFSLCNTVSEWSRFTALCLVSANILADV